MKNAARFLTLALLLCAAGCKRNPIDRLVDPNPSGALPFDPNGIYVVFDDELKTGGGLGFVPGGQNQSINLSVTDASRPGRQIAYTWNGNDVSSAPAFAQHLFAGFQLLVTPDFTTFDSASGKNLSAGNYATLKFSIKGFLSADTIVRVEGPDDGPGGNVPEVVNITSLGATWQDITLPIPTPSDFNSVKGFITVTFQYAQPSGTTAAGGGGTVFFDDIRYE